MLHECRSVHSKPNCEALGVVKSKETYSKARERHNKVGWRSSTGIIYTNYIFYTVGTSFTYFDLGH